MMTKYFIKR